MCGIGEIKAHPPEPYRAAPLKGGETVEKQTLLILTVFPPWEGERL